MEEEIKVNSKIRLVAISLALFIITLVTVTYAWTTSDFVQTTSGVTVESVVLSASFQGTSNVYVADLAPGEEYHKTFEIENNSDYQFTYSLKWNDVTNTFVDKNYFMYRIINIDTGEDLFFPKYLPSNSTTIINNISIDPGETHSYELIVYYINDPKYNQLQNANLYFTGNITISRGSVTTNVSDAISIFVNGNNVSMLPDLSSYSIDTSRTYCTDGSSISKVSNQLVIADQKPSTTCDVYLVSGSPAAITNDPYNLLIIDLDGGTLDSVEEVSYRYSGDIISLGTPTKNGYTFSDYSIQSGGSGGGGSQWVNGANLRMGTTYTYVKATWDED